MARTSTLLATAALLLAGCHTPASTAPDATAVSSSPSAPAEKPRPTFAAKATGMHDGVAWKPVFATIAVHAGKATLAIWDAPNVRCNVDATDGTLQFRAKVDYAAGKKTDLAKLRKPNPAARTPDYFVGEVSLLHVERRNLAARYSGTIELTAVPTEVDALAHAKVDIHADTAALEGELDAIVCMYE